MVCISRQDGARAQEVAQLVANQLGFRLIDEDILARAAVEAGVEQEVVADVERRKSRVVRLLEGLGSSGTAMGYVPPPNIVGNDQPPSEQLRGLIQSVIEEVTAAGSAVIVAHAASLALGERVNVLRVFVMASVKVRVKRLAAGLAVSEKEAARTVKQSDAARADYLQRFYGVRAELPTHYDLVINTDKLPPAAAAGLIVQAAVGHV